MHPPQPVAAERETIQSQEFWKKRNGQYQFLQAWEHQTYITLGRKCVSQPQTLAPRIIIQNSQQAYSKKTSPCPQCSLSRKFKQHSHCKCNLVIKHLSSTGFFRVRYIVEITLFPSQFQLHPNTSTIVHKLCSKQHPREREPVQQCQRIPRGERHVPERICPLSMMRWVLVQHGEQRLEERHLKDMCIVKVDVPHNYGVQVCESRELCSQQWV